MSFPFELILMGLWVSSGSTSLGGENVLTEWYSISTRKRSKGTLCRHKPSDSQVSHQIFSICKFRERNIRERKSVFLLLSLFFLSFSENRRHIYKRSWFDLSPNYFDDKCHCSCDIWRQLFACTHTDWHMDMQTCP